MSFLCFDPEDFQAGDFHAATFVAELQTRVPLERVRDDLRAHLSSLTQALYDLINQDYADFVLVSSKLNGVKHKVDELKQPITSFLKQLRAVQRALEVSAADVDAALAEREVVRKKKRALRQCLRFLTTLENAERVLEIGEGAGDGGGGGEASAGRGGAGSADTAPGANGEGEDAEWESEADGALDDGDSRDASGDDSDGGDRVVDDDPVEDESFADLFPALSAGEAASKTDGSRGASGAILPRKTAKKAENGSGRSCVTNGSGSSAATAAEVLTEECAALERVAHYALMLKADLVAVKAAGAEDSTAQLLRGMSVRASRVDSEVTRRLRTLFAQIVASPASLTAAAAEGVAAGTRVPAVATRSGSAGAAANGIASGGEGGGASDCSSGQRGSQTALVHCLRSFAALASGAEAEREFARVVVHPFVEANLTQGRLDGGGARGSCDGLACIYNDAVAHFAAAAGVALQAAEDMFVPQEEEEQPASANGAPSGPAGDVAGKRSTGSATSAAAAGAAGRAVSGELAVDLLCNGLWRPLQQALTSRLPGIFAPGMAATQQRNFLLSMTFARRLCDLCGRRHAAAAHRRLSASPAMHDFTARWNLSIYYQLRAREIAAALDAAAATADAGSVRAAIAPERRLAAGKGIEGGDAGGGRGAGAAGREGRSDDDAFDLPVTVQAWACMRRCWAEDVFLAPLAHRFLRLTLQALGRYLAWASAAVPGEATATAAASSPQRSANDVVLIAHDVDALCRLAAGELPALAVRRMAADGLPPAAADLVKAAAAEGAAAGAAVVEALWEHVTEHVTALCCSVLQAVRGITATYRMTNKPAPEKPSPFVPNILRPLRDFQERWGSRVPAAIATGGPDSGTGGGCGYGSGGGWTAAVMTAVARRYLDIVRELLLTVRQMEEALRKRKTKQQQQQQGRRTAGGGPSDTEKMMMQLLLDAHEFGRDLRALGFDPDVCRPYLELLQEVQPQSGAAAAAAASLARPASVAAAVASLGGAMPPAVAPPGQHNDGPPAAASSRYVFRLPPHARGGGVRRVVVMEGDITLYGGDAIVNAANSRMLGGGGVDGAIHRAAGPGLRMECEQVPETSSGVRCPAGEARITGGHRLPTKFVIHTVGPVYSTTAESAPILGSAYRNSLDLADSRRLQSVAFPAISCGVYGYPPEEAAAVAMDAVARHHGGVETVEFHLFGLPMTGVFAAAARRAFGPEVQQE